MTIFSEEDLMDTPVLQRWSIFVGEQGRPFVTGQHAFHEGVRTAIDEVLVQPRARRHASDATPLARMLPNDDERLANSLDFRASPKTTQLFRAARRRGQIR